MILLIFYFFIFLYELSIFGITVIIYLKGLSPYGFMLTHASSEILKHLPATRRELGFHRLHSGFDGPRPHFQGRQTDPNDEYGHIDGLAERMLTFSKVINSDKNINYQ